MAGPTIVIRIVGDTAGLSASVTNVAKTAERSANRMGTAFHGVIGALNASGVLGPFSDALYAIDQGVEALDNHAHHLGLTMIGLGGALAGVGLGLSVLGSSGVHQQLQAAIADTGKSYDDYAAAIDKADKTGTHFGYTSNQTEDALTKLTEAMGDPTKALKYLGDAMDLAALKHESLGEAALTLGRYWNGSTKVAKELGITIGPQLATATRAAASADKAATAATTGLANARQHLQDVQAANARQRQLTPADHIRLRDAQQAVTAAVAASTQVHAQSTDTTAAVTAATDRLAQSKQHLADVETELAAKQQSTLSDQIQLRNANQAVADAAQHYGEVATAQALAVQRANQRLVDSKANLANVESVLKTHAYYTSSDLSQLYSAQERVQNSAMGVAQAQAHQAAALEDAHQRQAKAAQHVTDVEGLQAQRHKLTTSDQTRLRDAHQGVTDATNALTAARVKSENTIAQASTSAADRIAKAKQHLADVEAALTAKQKTTTGQTDALNKATAEVTTATHKYHDALVAQQTAHDNVTTAAGTQAKAMTDLHDKIKGQAEAAANSFTGKLRDFKARLEDIAAYLGKTFGPAISAAGLALVGIGSALEIGKTVTGWVKNMGKVSKAAGEAETATEDLTGSVTALEGSAAAGTGLAGLAAGAVAAGVAMGVMAKMAADALNKSLQGGGLSKKKSGFISQLLATSNPFAAIGTAADNWVAKQFGFDPVAKVTSLSRDAYHKLLGLVGKVPFLQEGGLLTSDGLVYAHAGEVVLPTQGASMGPSAPLVHFDHAEFNHPIDLDAFTKKLEFALSAGLPV